MRNDKKCQRCGSFGGYGCYECTPDHAQSELQAAVAAAYDDAQAALEAVKRDARNEALREAIRVADAVSRRGRNGQEGLPWDGWTTLEYKKYQLAAVDVKHEIENLMEDNDE